MTILQRYILKELMGPLALGLAVFTFLFLIGQIFRLTDLLLNSGVPPLLAIEVIASLLPNVLSWTIPMAMLMGILLGIGRLSADREILAIRTSGVNLARVCFPVIVFATLVSGAMIWANQNMVPYLNLKSADLATQIAFRAISAVPPGRAHEMDSGAGGPATTFLYEARDPENGGMNGVRLFTQMETSESAQQDEQEDEINDKIQKLLGKKDEKSRKQLASLHQAKQQIVRLRKVNEALVVAKSGRMSTNISDRLITIELTSGSINLTKPDEPSSHDVIRFASLQRSFSPGLEQNEQGQYQREPREMSSAEMLDSLKSTKMGKKRRNSYRTEYYRRLSVPLACLAFALIAIPLAVYARPTGKAIAFAISLLLILVYYGLLNYGMSLGRTGSAFAPVAMFLPNILLSVVGIGLLYKMVRR